MSAERLITAASSQFLHTRNPPGLEFISLSGSARVWLLQLKKNKILLRFWAVLLWVGCKHPVKGKPLEETIQGYFNYDRCRFLGNVQVISGASLPA